MKRAQEVVAEGPEEEFVRDFDLRQIDCEDRDSFWRAKYMWHFNGVLRMVASALQAPARIIEVGSAQGNLALTLAEQGYRTVAADLRPGFLSYSRKKYECGDVSWVCGDAFALPERGEFDGAILSEILEHVAHPDDLLRKATTLVRQGGFIFVTTPNGDHLRNRRPSLAEARRDTAAMELRQFGPAGDDHLFELRPSEVPSLVPDSTRLTGLWSMNSILFCNAAQPLLRVRGLRDAVQLAAHVSSAMPILRWRFADTIAFTLQRTN